MEHLKEANRKSNLLAYPQNTQTSLNSLTRDKQYEKASAYPSGAPYSTPSLLTSPTNIRLPKKTLQGHKIYQLSKAGAYLSGAPYDAPSKVSL